MHQIFQILAQVAQWCASSPAHMQMTHALLMGAKRGYDSLSPATKAKVDSIMIRAAEYLAKAAVGDVLGWARSEAVTLGLNSDAATVAEVGVRRVSEVGLSKAFEEMGRSAGSSAGVSSSNPNACRQCSGNSANMFNTKCCQVRLCESCKNKWQHSGARCEFCGRT